MSELVSESDLWSPSTSEPETHREEVLLQPGPERSPVKPKLDARGLPEASQQLPVVLAGVAGPAGLLKVGPLRSLQDAAFRGSSQRHQLLC